jgi:hypothetical protein
MLKLASPGIDNSHIAVAGGQMGKKYLGRALRLQTI